MLQRACTRESTHSTCCLHVTLPKYKSTKITYPPFISRSIWKKKPASTSQSPEQALCQVFHLPVQSATGTETETTGTSHSRKPNSGQGEQTLTNFTEPSHGFASTKGEGLEHGLSMRGSVGYVLGGHYSGTSKNKPTGSHVPEGQVRGLGAGSRSQPITDEQASCLCASGRRSVFPG